MYIYNTCSKIVTAGSNIYPLAKSKQRSTLLTAK